MGAEPIPYRSPTEDLSARLLRRQVRGLTRCGFNAAEIGYSLSLSVDEVAAINRSPGERGGYMQVRATETMVGGASHVEHSLMSGAWPDPEVLDLCAMVARLAFALNRENPSAPLAPRALALLARLGYDFIPDKTP